MELAETESPVKVIDQLLDEIEYQDWITKQSASPEQAEMRWRNVEDLLKWVRNIAQKDPEKTLVDVVGHLRKKRG